MIKKIIQFLLIAVTLVYSQTTIEKIQKAEGEDTLSRIDAIYYRIIAERAPQYLPANLRSGIPERPPKCGFGAAVLITRYWNRFSSSQQEMIKKVYQIDKTFSNVLVTAHFRIYYDTVGPDAVSSADTNSNSIPDYVDEVKKALDYSWHLEVDSLGYLQPIDSTGLRQPTYKLNIFIRNLGFGGYGATFPGIAFSGGLSYQGYSPYIFAVNYIEIDNDFLVSEGYYTTGINAMQVTVAHEFFHAIQLGYNLWDNVTLSKDDVYYFEISSTWMEDIAFTSVNDYYGYLKGSGGIFRNLDQPFDSFSGLHQYGMAIWNRFLSDKYGLNKIKEIWTRIRQRPALFAMKNVLNFNADFAEFYIWNWFTGKRANPTLYYAEGDSYPEVKINQDNLNFSSSVDATENYLSGHYYRYQTSSPDPVTFILSGIVDGNQWSGIAINKSGTVFPVSNFNTSQVITNAEVTSSPDSIVYMPINFYTFGSWPFHISVRGGISPSLANLNPSPNPFILGEHLNVNLPFNSKSSGSAELSIFSISGHLVMNQNIGNRLKDPTDSVDWDGRDQNGNPVPSGIYIYLVKGNGWSQVKKFAVIRR